MDSLSQLVTHSGPNCKFSWLHHFPVKSYKIFIISIVFYCFRHLWCHNPQNKSITVLIFCIKPPFTMIHHLWRFHPFSISGTYLENRGGGHNWRAQSVWSCSKSPMWSRVNGYFCMIHAPKMHWTCYCQVMKVECRNILFCNDMHTYLGK